MPPPTNATELLDLVQKSGVVEEPKLRAYVKKLSASSGLPAEPNRLAGLLVRDGVLTYFQAEQLLQGKYKRFTIGKYKVLEKLGSGGMGQVFLCEHTLMRRRVAVKVLPTAKAEDHSSRERFYREARAVAALDHPNIVRAYDIDQDENLHFLVMEYVDGTNFQDLVKRIGPLDITRACHYVYAAAVGLQHAHEMGLVHRDIKPGNLLVDRAGVVKILDMGLARFFHDTEDNLTRQNDEHVLGTADYVAPEQAMDSHTVDIRADIYSLGATFYYLLTGSPLFPEGSVPQKLIWHQNRQPRPVKSLRPDLPDPLVAVLERMTAKNPAQRYQTPADVMAALAGWVATPIPPPTEREMPTVSRAAGGRAGTTLAGGSARGGSGQTDAPTVISPGTPVVTPAPVGAHPLAPTPPPHQGVWETLDAETGPLALDDTDGTPERPRRAPGQPLDRRVWLYAGLGALALGVLAGAYFAFSGKSKTTPPGNGDAGGRRIVVSKAGGENAVPTLREALAKAAAGDTIVIAEPKLTEPALRLDRQKHKDVTIESGTADGKSAVIEAAGTPGVMLDVAGVEGVRLRNVAFDGRDKADVGVQVSGVAAGTTVEGVSVRGVKSAGFKLSNAAGEAGRSVTLDRCRAVLSGPAQTGVLVFAANAETRWVMVTNSRVEGSAAGTGLRVEGAAADLEVTGNRLFDLGVALSFVRPAGGKTMKAQVIGNTAYQANVGLQFELTPPAAGAQPGKFELIVDRNYFAKIPQLAVTAKGGAVAGVTIPNNGYGPETEPGNVHFQIWPVQSPLLPTPDPNNNATFLRFTNGPPEAGPNKVRVGAP